jgi:hypothetical protein
MTRHNGTPNIKRLLSALVIMLLLMTGAAYAGENIATFKTVQGAVDVLKKGALPASAAKVGDSLSTGDIVRTKSGATAEVQFTDGSVLKISQRSRIDIGAYYGDSDKNLTKVKLSRGRVDAVVPKPGERLALKGGARQFEIHTPNAVAGVRGTGWGEGFNPDNITTDVAVAEGDVFVYNLNNPDLVILVSGGNYTTVSGGQPPTPPQQGSGGFSGAAVPFSYSGSTAGTGFNSILGALAAALAGTPPPPPPPQQQQQQQQPQQQPTSTVVGVDVNFN